MPTSSPADAASCSASCGARPATRQQVPREDAARVLGVVRDDRPPAVELAQRRGPCTQSASAAGATRPGRSRTGSRRRARRQPARRAPRRGAAPRGRQRPDAGQVGAHREPVGRDRGRRCDEPHRPETIRTLRAPAPAPSAVAVEAGRGVEDAGVHLLRRRGRRGGQAHVARDLVGEARPTPSIAASGRRADLDERVEHLLAQRCPARGRRGRRGRAGGRGRAAASLPSEGGRSTST